jgi:hypothetical protein
MAQYKVIVWPHGHGYNIFPISIHALDNLSEETAQGKRTWAEKRLWNSAVPFDCQVDSRKDGGDGLVYPDDDNTEDVRLAFKWYVVGRYSDTNVARMLNEEVIALEGATIGS